jgi:excisionase family DNA binding protein
MPEQLLFTINEVAAMISVTPRTIKKWREIGRFPRECFRDGRVARWNREQIDAWIEERSVSE